MKKLLVLMMVLAMAGIAEAELRITVDQVVNPPDTQIFVPPTGEVGLGIWGDGETPTNIAVALAVQGPGTITAVGATVIYNPAQSASSDIVQPDLQDWINGMADAGYPGITSVVLSEFLDTDEEPAPLDGLLVDFINFECLGDVDVTLLLFDPDTIAIYDTQVIHQIPEPMTITLLSLGGLLLRRRR